MSLFNQLDDLKFDVLREVGNIGAGHAATALSKLLDKPVDMKVPQVRIVEFEEIPESVGGAEEVVIAVFLRVIGDAPGNLFFLLSRDSALSLLSKMVGLEHIPSDEDWFDLNEIQISAIQEIGNILAGSYLSSLADFTQLDMSPTVPSMTIDMAGAILSYGIMQFGAMGEHAVLIDTSFYDGTDRVEGHFFLIPDPESFEKIFSALGVPHE
ncbi:chemotaxis protein CheC [Marinicrinis lubricantis]|uniref:Chemotaxis protein CheC n=1 Tax=Marinicrinis lubricantis TaxID=2086470 RepID=A0ABW1IMC6_9BACL